MGVRRWGGGGDGHEARASLPPPRPRKPVDRESVEARPTSGAFLRGFLSPTFSLLLQIPFGSESPGPRRGSVLGRDRLGRPGGRALAALVLSGLQIHLSVDFRGRGLASLKAAPLKSPAPTLAARCWPPTDFFLSGSPVPASKRTGPTPP